MTKLECSVDSCIHNADDCCCRGEIDVKGKKACSMCDTCCGSYQKATNGRVRNSVSYPKENTEINCEAVKCIYNQSSKCTATNVGIAGYGARDKEETECSTFREKTM